jgi:hypothetical protein
MNMGRDVLMYIGREGVCACVRGEMKGYVNIFRGGGCVYVFGVGMYGYVWGGKGCI